MVKTWIIGTLAATLLLWATAALTVNDVYVPTWDAALRAEVHAAGWPMRWRSEGWGFTHFGRHGAIGAKRMLPDAAETIVLWGDSYVEALQANDAEKTASQANVMLANANVQIVAMGLSDLVCADYVLRMRRLEAPCPSIRAHVILICDMADTLPTDVLRQHATFRREDAGYRLVPDHPGSPVLARYRRFMHRAKLQLVDSLLRDALGRGGSLRQLRFRPGPVASGGAPSDPGIPKDAVRAWDFLLARVREASAKPVLVVYCPRVPRIEQGGIACDDPAAGAFASFAARAADHGIAVVDLTRRLIDLYEVNGCFARGFQNGRPGDGHLNADGHRLLAQAIVASLRATGLCS